MGTYLHQKYDEQDIEEFEDEDYEKDFEAMLGKYTPRIEGTELEFGIVFLYPDYFPILTSRINGTKKRNIIFFDFIKMWQTDI